MGVGVFSSDFNETGGTFIVSGPVIDEAKYEEWLDLYALDEADAITDEAEDGLWNFRRAFEPAPEEHTEYFKKGRFDSKIEALEHALKIEGVESLDFKTWALTEEETFEQRLQEKIRDVCSDIGMTVLPPEKNGFPSAPFDKDFTMLVDSNIVGAGIRTWQDDYVVGVGATGPYYIAEPEAFASEVLLNTGRSSEEFSEKYKWLVDNINAYIRLSLMNEDFDCRMKSTGYTSKAYKKPDDIDDLLIEARNRIDASFKELIMPLEEAIFENRDTVQRHQLLKSILELQQDGDLDVEKKFKVIIPVFDKEGQEVYFIDPIEERIMATPSNIGLNQGLSNSDFNEICEGYPKDSFVSIVRDTGTSNWFKAIENELKAVLNDGALPILATDSEVSYAGNMPVQFKVDDQGNKYIMRDSPSKKLRFDI